MNLLEEIEIDYPYTVTVTRPSPEYDSAGNYTETFETVIASMRADIQLSIKIRNYLSEDNTGTSNNALWMMFCCPPMTVREGDHVTDGTRTFIVDAVGEWGSHTECVMRKCT